jgi:hypothetical protein
MAELTTAPAVSVRASGLRLQLDRSSVAGPVLVVAVVLGFLIGGRLLVYHGNPTGLIQFGKRFVQYTHPPRGAIVASPDGYDGQFFWPAANDPLLLSNATIVNLGRAGVASHLGQAAALYRLQRVAYPTLAYVLAVGQPGAIPWTMLAVNVLAVLGITAGFAAYARTRGWSTWWAVALGLQPGFMLATMRDLSDPLAAASMLGGLLMWQRGRRWWTAALFALAVLAREPMTLAVAAVCIDAVVRWWRSRQKPGALRRAVHGVWPVLVVPAAAFLAWQVYIRARYTGTTTLATADQPNLALFKDYIVEARRTLDQDSPLGAAWDLAYLTLMLIGMGTAVALLRRGTTAAGVAALLFALSTKVVVFGDQWGDTRYGALVFATLLLAGLEQRSRFAVSCFAVSIAAVAAAMTVFVSLAIPGA